MKWLLVLLLLAVVAYVAYRVLQSRREKAATVRQGRRDPLADDPGLFDVHRIRPGDVVTYAGIDHVVRGSITLSEGGTTWREHLLDGSTGRRWLTVEDDEGDLELTLWMRREGTNLVPEGDVILDDKVHRQIERGRATYTAEGTTGTPPTGTVDYADYATADKTGLIAFERWAETQSYEVSTGRALTLGEINVLHAGPPTP